LIGDNAFARLARYDAYFGGVDRATMAEALDFAYDQILAASRNLVTSVA